MVVPAGYSAARYFFADIAVQKSQDRELDWSRAKKMCIFGFLQSFAFGWCYIRVYPQWIAQNTFQIFNPRPFFCSLFDAFILTPVFYFPIYYAVAATIDGSDPYNSFKESIISDTLTCAKVWVPLNAVNFFVVPAPFRFYFSTISGTAWSAWLSFYKHDV